MAAIDVRTASRIDEEDIAELIKELSEAVGQWYEPREFSLDALLTTLREMLYSPEFTFLLAVDDGRKVGLLVFQTRLSLAARGNRATITDFIVSKDYRRRGVGRLLVEEAKRLSRSRGCTGIDVTTEIENERAMGFYRALGFERRHVHFEMNL